MLRNTFLLHIKEFSRMYRCHVVLHDCQSNEKTNFKFYITLHYKFVTKSKFNLLSEIIWQYEIQYLLPFSIDQETLFYVCHALYSLQPTVIWIWNLYGWYTTYAFGVRCENWFFSLMILNIQLRNMYPDTMNVNNCCLY